jgi:putative tryptophan/tyrosine transport system substrate-binding protein
VAANAGMRRRQFLGAIGGVAAWPFAGHAQQATKVLRVGTANAQPRTAPQWIAFVQRMAELGYREGENFTYDHVQIQNAAGWEAGYRAIVAQRPDIVLAAGPESSLKAALAAADGLPVVMIAVDYDPLAKGYVQSLSRPTGSVTGVYFQNVELVGKRLELLKQAFPNVAAMTVFWGKSAPDHWAALQAVAPRFGVQMNGIEFAERPYDYERAIADAAAGGNFFYAGGSPFFFLDRTRLAEFAIKHRMAMVCELREQVVAGGLISYGPSLTAMFALAAKYVDRIAKGAKPADLPVEQPTKFELVTNLKTAKAIGIDLPAVLLTRADEVIE